MTFVHSTRTDAASTSSASPEPAASPPPERKRRKFSINIYSAWCKRCGICVEFCPKNVLENDPLGTPEAVRSADCTGCTLCVLHCPDFAITVCEED